MRRAPLVLGEILLPLAGEGADRRMRVDQNIPLHTPKNQQNLWIKMCTACRFYKKTPKN
jgi:hypothetical protein